MNKARSLRNGKLHRCIESKKFRENQGMEACSMLKKLNGILNILICSFIGAFAGYVIYVCLDYRTHPGLYDMQSAPWYTGILYYGIYTIVPLIIAIILKLFLWRKLKQQKKEE
jgi:ACR3 family arsenite efflux pump ArsB